LAERARKSRGKNRIKTSADCSKTRPSGTTVPDGLKRAKTVIQYVSTTAYTARQNMTASTFNTKRCH